MKLRSIGLPALGVTLVSSLTIAGLSACGGSGDPEPTAATGGMEPQKVADMLHAVMAADRKVYVANVVNRLTQSQEVMIQNPDSGEMEKMHGSEDWETTFGTLPLPAQQFRYGSEEAYDINDSFSYGLISSWAINTNHLPKTDMEKEMIAKMEESGEPQYGEETIGEQPYFIAMYPDRATARACWECHNEHPDSPKTDFEENDVMGGIVIRLPM